MPGTGREVDASFYNLIYELTATDRSGTAADRRREPRHVFAAKQRVAFSRGLTLPNEAEYLEVQCHDLTRRGFSFLLTRRPVMDELVAAFGCEPETIYVAARVTHSKDVLVDAEGNVVREIDQRCCTDETGDTLGTWPMVLVGCRFVARLKG